MEKTSREYAEKSAEEMYLTDGVNSLYKIVQERKQAAHVEGYLKAVEETNVKELREALETAKHTLTQLNENGVVTNTLFLIDNALNKTK